LFSVLFSGFGPDKMLVITLLLLTSPIRSTSPETSPLRPARSVNSLNLSEDEPAFITSTSLSALPAIIGNVSEINFEVVLP